MSEEYSIVSAIFANQSLITIDIIWTGTFCKTQLGGKIVAFGNHFVWHQESMTKDEENVEQKLPCPGGTKFPEKSGIQEMPGC